MTVDRGPMQAGVHLARAGPSAGEARRFVRATFDSWDLADLIEPACMLVSELVANVLLHAGTDLDLRLRRTDGGVRVEVHDRSARMPERKYYSATSTTGRGLMLLNAVAQRWGSEPTSGGKAVWFELDVAAAGTLAPPVTPAAVRLEDWDDLLPGPEGGDPGTGGPVATLPAWPGRSETASERNARPAKRARPPSRGPGPAASATFASGSPRSSWSGSPSSWPRAGATPNRRPRPRPRPPASRASRSPIPCPPAHRACPCRWGRRRPSWSART